MKYIDNNPQKGIEYDFNKIRHLYNSLGIPKDFKLVPFYHIEHAKYFIDLSERSIGKTSSWLLFGMCVNKIYGSIIQYLRSNEDELKPSHLTELFACITDYNNGQYIKILTNGEYNSVYYHWKKFYYCFVDENGDRIKTCERHFLQCLSVNNAMDYKSGYNAPNGDIIIFDEFIKTYLSINESLNFFDLCSTIIRKRRSPIIIMLANTINFNSKWFEELNISKQVKKMKKGETKLITTELGTKLYIRVLGGELTQDKRIFNSLFFGFQNKKLSAITGEGDLWAFEEVPHILDIRNKETVARNIYIEYLENEFLNLHFMYNEEIGNFLEITKATKTYDDSIILSLYSLSTNNRYYGVGTSKFGNKLMSYHARNKIYYGTNEVGSIFKDYLKQCKLLQGKI